MTIYDWVLLVIGFAFFAIGLYERGQRKGFEEAEKLYEPVLKLAESWARVHLAQEKRMD